MGGGEFDVQGVLRESHKCSFYAGDGTLFGFSVEGVTRWATKQSH